MSLMRELELVSYDIEQLWIEGKNPVQIAGELDCHIALVDAWIQLNNLGAKEVEDVADGYYGA
jgi:hypothetical protein